jgi:hypothetical protein
MATKPRKKPLPRRRWTRPISWAVWNIQKKNKQRAKTVIVDGEAFTNAFGGEFD